MGFSKQSSACPSTFPNWAPYCFKGKLKEAVYPQCLHDLVLMQLYPPSYDLLQAIGLLLEGPFALATPWPFSHYSASMIPIL